MCLPFHAKTAERIYKDYVYFTDTLKPGITNWKHHIVPYTETSGLYVYGNFVACERQKYASVVTNSCF